MESYKRHGYPGILFCVLILVCLPRITQALSKTKNPLMETIVDLRDQSPYEYKQTNHQIGVVSKFSAMQITFDLDVNMKERDFMKIPLLSFRGQTTELIFYLNGWDEFGIMHRDSRLDGLVEYTKLLDGNLFVVPRIPGHPYRRYYITILDGAKVTVNVDGYSICRRINRQICLQNETMDVWLDRSGFKISGTIGYLLIQTT